MLNPELLRKLYIKHPPATLEDISLATKDFSAVRSDLLRLDTIDIAPIVSLISDGAELGEELARSEHPDDCLVSSLYVLKRLQRLAMNQLANFPESDLPAQRPSYLARISSPLAESYASAPQDSLGNHYISLRLFLNEHDQNGEIGSLATNIYTLTRRIEKAAKRGLTISELIDDMARIAQSIFGIAEGIMPFSLVLQEPATRSSKEQAHLLSDLISGDLPPLFTSRNQLALFMFSQILDQTDRDWFSSRLTCYQTICNSTLKAIEDLPAIIATALNQSLEKLPELPESHYNQLSLIVKILRNKAVAQIWRDCVKNGKLNTNDVAQLKSITGGEGFSSN